MRKLDIIVTHYKESQEIVKGLLDSIGFQQNVDNFRVIIVNDGNDVVLKESFLKKYKYDIEYIIAEHGGVSCARQKGMDFSDAEYIMFCDCDDIFFSALGLFTIYEYMKEGFDLFVPKFKEELKREDGSMTYMNHTSEDNTFIHGKVYRRQFLVDKNINWNNNIKIHEDLFFNCIAAAESNQTKRTENCFYLWKYNKESVTRRTDKFIQDTYSELFKSYDLLIQEFKNRGFHENARSNVANLIYRVYYDLPDWSAEDTIRMMADLSLFLKKYENEFKSVTFSEKLAICSQAKYAMAFLNSNNFKKFVKTLLDM